MNKKGQVNFVSILQYPLVLLIFGILLYAMWPIVNVFWTLNENVPNYYLARSILDLVPLIAIIGLTVLYLITRPREPQYEGS